MHQAQPICPCGSEDRPNQQRTLPSFRDLLARGDFLPEHKSLSQDRQSSANVTYGFSPWDETSTDPLLSRRPCLLAQGRDRIQVHDELLNPESKGDALNSGDHQTQPRNESLGKTSSNAHGSNNGPLGSDTESLFRRWQAESIGSPTTTLPRKRRREAEALDNFGTAPKRRMSERDRDSKKRFRKQENSKTAAIAHMEKERERRLQIGDLIKQIASYIKYSGPKVEILKRTVECIHEARSKEEILEAELEDLKSRYQALSEQCSESTRALTRSLARAEETWLREDKSGQGNCRWKE
ncbi:MAG: hypothetical protein LQ349_003702 [Xanthoria aureola]|nr:MAG: hypothetical protein LQ349_003702 [Xanthoria aureola]